MAKEFEIAGCVEVADDVSEEEFIDKFLGFLEENDWYFGGGINEIIDGIYKTGPNAGKEK